MDNKIYEEALASALRRIEVLEDKISRISIPNKEGFYEPAKQKPQNKFGMASPGQKKYIVALGGIAPINMTKQEAGILIDKLLDEKETDEREQVIEPKEVDTDNIGIDSEGLL
jgi:hypothetical protein